MYFMCEYTYERVRYILNITKFGRYYRFQVLYTLLTIHETFSRSSYANFLKKMNCQEIPLFLVVQTGEEAKCLDKFYT